MQVNNAEQNADRQWFQAMTGREQQERTTIVGNDFRTFMNSLPADAATGPYNVHLQGHDNPVNDMPYSTYAEAALHAGSLSRWNMSATIKEIGHSDRAMFVQNFPAYHDPELDAALKTIEAFNPLTINSEQ